MLGSHNSFTYLKPKGIINKLLLPWSKCQKLTLIEQYDKGVRYFDIRVRFKKDIGAIIVHNKTEYIGSVYKELEALNKYIKEPVYLRIILDIRDVPNDKLFQKNSFINFVTSVKKNNCRFKVDSAIIFWKWEELLNPIITVKEFHASVSFPWYKYILGTRYCAKITMESKDYISTEKKQSNEVILIDYVDLWHKD